MSFGDKWDGSDRRKSMSHDHDLLLKIANDVGHIKSGLDTHVKEDKTIQEDLKGELNDVKIKLAQYAGGLAVIAILLKVVWK